MKEMILREKLIKIANAVADAAERDSALEESLLDTLTSPTAKKRSRNTSGMSNKNTLSPEAVLHKKGEEGLRKELEEQDITGLQKIASKYKMEQWAKTCKDKDRLINHIIEMSKSRAYQGDRFQ